MRFCVIDDGVIKFDSSGFIPSDSLALDEYSELETWRAKLFALNLIGEYPTEQIGFGNLSQRRDYSHLHKTSKAQFVITGTQTGKYPNLNGNLYTRILDYSFEKNSVVAQGKVNASSETLTHAALYESNDSISTIFHVHHHALWSEMLAQGYPSTAVDIPYGTLEMARNACELFSGESEGVFAMAGHADGIVAFASTLDQCGNILLRLYHKLLNT
jgi:ribulose-5-phosphate 4-epimerase/fuculose-1-phosphate aldolase